MTHVFYSNSVPKSEFFNELVPLLQKLGARCLIRIKGNLYPNTEILHEHPMHFDYKFCHSGAILSLNTCDGYTKLKDGTKIESVANRMVIFPANIKHTGTTCSDEKRRVVINFNYFRK